MRIFELVTLELLCLLSGSVMDLVTDFHERVAVTDLKAELYRKVIMTDASIIDRTDLLCVRRHIGSSATTCRALLTLPGQVLIRISSAISTFSAAYSQSPRALIILLSLVTFKMYIYESLIVWIQAVLTVFGILKPIPDVRGTLTRFWAHLQSVKSLRGLRSSGRELIESENFKKALVALDRQNATETALGRIALPATQAIEVLSSVLGLIMCAVTGSEDAAVSVVGGASVSSGVEQLASINTLVNTAFYESGEILTILNRPCKPWGEVSPEHRLNKSWGVSIKDVHFKYAMSDTENLSGVSVDIHAGEKVAICGPIGSGKSTLVRLLLGVYSTSEGSVKLGGFDIHDLNPAWLRSSGVLGCVLQDNEENGVGICKTARELFILGDCGHGISDEKICQVAETQCGFRGLDLDSCMLERLSGGQLQRLLLARALVTNPQILVLDEATSAMDEASQHSVLANSLLDKRTVICVSHRPAAALMCDRVLVMEGGRIVEDDAIAVLLEKPGSRFNHWMQQSLNEDKVAPFSPLDQAVGHAEMAYSLA